MTYRMSYEAKGDRYIFDNIYFSLCNKTPKVIKNLEKYTEYTLTEMLLGTLGEDYINENVHNLLTSNPEYFAEESRKNRFHEGILYDWYRKNDVPSNNYEQFRHDFYVFILTKDT